MLMMFSLQESQWQASNCIYKKVTLVTRLVTKYGGSDGDCSATAHQHQVETLRHGEVTKECHCCHTVESRIYPSTHIQSYEERINEDNFFV